MKKVLALILALVMALSLVACGQEAAPADEGSSEPVKLTLALRGGTYADVIQGCLADFEAAHNCKCEVLALEEDDLHSKVALDAMNAAGSYDLCMVDGSWMAEYTAAGVLANLSEMGYSFDDDVIEATTAISYYDGDIYLAPYYGNVTVLMYNKTNVGDAEMANLDDMLAICEQAKADGKLGFIYRGDTENNTVVDFLSVLLSFGGWVIDDNNQPTVNTPEFKKAVEFYQKLIATGAAQKKDDLIASIGSGAGTMAIGWPGWYQADADMDYTAITGVASEGDTAYNANVAGIWTIGIPANSTHSELALELLEYLMDKDVQYATIPAGGVPCRTSCLTDSAVLADHPQFAVIEKALAGCKYRPVIEEWTDFYTILGTELGQIFAGAKSVDDGLTAAQTQLEALMG